MDTINILDYLKNNRIQIRILDGRIEIKNINTIDKNILNKIKEKEEEIIQLLRQLDPTIIIPVFTKPYITQSGELRIPFDCHPRYKYWTRGADGEWRPVNESMKIQEILKELGASEEILKKY